ncbi:hypothetical protein [Pseudomonas inefficax]|uniref:hypothetical protein n=1 Tax=Pseudomonas inefficax TaxID=2078786 RepID=UPI004046F38D
MKLTRDAAKALLDGGIDATAVLNRALKRALLHTVDDDQAGLKKSFGIMMAGVLEATVNVALQAYPEMKPDREAWRDIVKARAASRAG